MYYVLFIVEKKNALHLSLIYSLDALLIIEQMYLYNILARKIVEKQLKVQTAIKI